ncbi:MAG: 4-hydroxy-tetrahydrodipicolinate reductase [Candidatus Eisenbacteria bacterium]|nr:4-hydroxy-tetrahydrodipicolinate reductase [Candidatus Eisenbacteria bacterium]
MIPLVVVGAAGRMGRAVEQAAAAAAGFTLKARVDPAGTGAGYARDAAPHVEAGDVVVEFSSPAGCRAAAGLCAARGAALVSGTTGLSAQDEAAVRDAAGKVAVLRAANFSLGVLALRRALQAALAAVPADWDLEIVERHHRGKADSPSGTALALAAEAARARGLTEQAVRCGRERGRTGPRLPGEIAVHALRGGTWVGDHEVLLAGEGEWLELRHVAQDRAAFAHGVLAAARFVAGASPGLYTLDDAVNDRGREP